MATCGVKQCSIVFLKHSFTDLTVLLCCSFLPLARHSGFGESAVVGEAVGGASENLQVQPLNLAWRDQRLWLPDQTRILTTTVSYVQDM